jgi:fimbrial chaperone protein
MTRLFFGPQSRINLNSLFTYLLMSMIALGTPASAQQAGVMVAPTRIILEGGSRSEQMIIVNNSRKNQAFRVSFRNMAFTADGYTDVTEPRDGQLFADNMIRVSTREMRLRPGETQILRVLLRKPEGLAPGEYRSHMVLTGLPDAANPMISEQLNEQLSIRVLPQYNYIFPVIVRQGQLSSSYKDAAIKQVKITADGTYEMQVTVETTGNRSMFVDTLLVDTKAKKDAPPIFQSKNLSVLWPTNKRSLNFLLSKAQYERYKAGDYVLRIQEVNNIGGKVGDMVEKKVN